MMNTGTHASDGIGFSTLTSGNTKRSTLPNRPISIPSGTPTIAARARPTTIR